MKAAELRIGDYCLVHPSNMLIRIAAIHNKKVAYHAVSNRLEWVRIGLIRPIPLTKEILSRICTKVDPIEGNIYEYTEYDFGEDVLVSHSVNEPFSFYFENTPGETISKEVKYVHELQQLLRLCGVEKEIEL